MKTAERTIGNKNCVIIADEKPCALLIQTLGRFERNGLEEEVDMIRHNTGLKVVMVAVIIEDWAEELTPWSDATVARNKVLGDGAKDTLKYITDTLIPYLKNEFGQLPVILGGYSIGGLFALWAASATDALSAVAAVSPSVWINGWTDFAKAHPVKAQNVYLSLGDKEEHVKNKTFAKVGDCIREEYAVIKNQLGNNHCTLEWNSGNHFVENGGRTAKGFAWCVKKAVE